jgi:uncharacterized membrane protein YesL
MSAPTGPRSAGAALGVIRQALLEAYDDFARLVVFNLLWLLLSLPLVTAPPAAAGLYHATRELALRRPVDWHTFFEGFRQHFWLSWRWGLPNLLVAGVLGFNAWFYGQLQQPWTPLVQGALLGLFVLWLLLQLYTFPLLLAQQDRRLRVALRNSLVLYLKYPGFSLVLVGFTALLAALSTLLQLPWALISASLLAYVTHFCIFFLLKDDGANV